jgi:Domain of unknown function (DUF4329)
MRAIRVSMFVVLTSVLTIICVLCHADTSPCEIAIAEIPASTFGSAIEAARAMSDRYRLPSALLDVEYVGAVYALPDGRFGTAVGRGCPRRDGFRFRIPDRPRAILVALWHTHGSGDFSRRFFSATDAATVRRTGLPFYLATADGGLRVLDHAEASKPQARLPGSTVRVRSGAFRGRLVARSDG